MDEGIIKEVIFSGYQDEVSSVKRDMEVKRIKEERISGDEESDTNEEKLFLARAVKVEYSHDYAEYQSNTVSVMEYLEVNMDEKSIKEEILTDDEKAVSSVERDVNDKSQEETISCEPATYEEQVLLAGTTKVEDPLENHEYESSTDFGSQCLEPKLTVTDQEPKLQVTDRKMEDDNQSGIQQIDGRSTFSDPKSMQNSRSGQPVQVQVCLRTPRHVTVEQRLMALDRIDKGESQYAVAREYGVSTAAVSKWRKNRERSNAFYAFNKKLNKGADVAKRVSFRKTSSFEPILYDWFTKQRSKGIPISGPMLREKAIELHASVGSGTFKASSGWLEKFKKRFGIRQPNIAGEPLLADDVAADSFREEFVEHLVEEKGLSSHQIFNADEAGLNCLPSKTLAGENERSAPGHKIEDDNRSVIQEIDKGSTLSDPKSMQCSTAGHPVEVQVCLRTPRHVTVEQRLMALDRIDKGESQYAVAREYGVSTAAVSKWRKNRERSKAFYTSKLNKGADAAKRVSFRKTSSFESILYDWFTKQRSKGIPISGPMLREKAIELHTSVGSGIFKASNGWLERFKKRFDIRQLNIAGESLSADENAADSHRKVVEHLVEEEDSLPNEIFDADEAGSRFEL